MENFLQSFLENGLGFSIWKTPINVDYSSDTSIIGFLQKITFKPDVLVEFKKILKSACSSEVFSVKNDIIKKVIKGLIAVLESDIDIKIKAQIFRCVFKSFASKCTSDESLFIVQFFLVLSHILGINSLVGDVNDNKDSDVGVCVINAENFKKGFEIDSRSVFSNSFTIFKELLLCLSKTFINVNSSEVQPFNKWLQHVIKKLADFQPFQGIILEIIYICTEIDLKLLEGNLDHVICSIFAQKVSVDESFSESYANFLVKTFRVFAQFQRIVKFVSKFLSGLKAVPICLTKEIILPLDFVSEFSKTVSVASNQQCLSLFDVLLQNVDECFNLISQEDPGFKSSLMFVVSELLIIFFKNVKLYAPNIASTTLQAFIEKLNNVKKIHQKFACFLFSNKSFFLNNEKIVATFLELCFFCMEIEMLINCYKNSVLHPSDIKESDVDCDWQCCLTSKQWKKLVKFVLKSKLKGCDLQCFQLAMQKLRACKLENQPLTEDSTLKIAIHQLSTDVNVIRIFQQVPPEDLVILMNALTVEQCKTIIRTLFIQLQQSEKKEDWKSWLSDSAIQENPTFIGFLFSELLKSTGSLLQGMISDKHSSKMSWFSEEYFDDCHSVSRETLDRLPKKVNALLKKGRKLRKSVTGHDSLVRIVDAFKSLPLFFMKENFWRLGLSFAVVMWVFVADDENAARLTFESISNYLSHDLDASICFDIGLFMKCFNELLYENESTNFAKLKIVESLVRNVTKMKHGLDQIGEMIDSPDSFKHESPLKMLEAQVLLHNELGKSWQRGNKRKAENDLIGSYRVKLAKLIRDESREMLESDLGSENSKILLKVLAIEINAVVKENDKNEIKNLMERKFPPFFEMAVRNLKTGFDQPSVLLLTTVLQSMPQLRRFLPEDSLLKIWKALKTYDKFNWKLFCVNSTANEFNKILEDSLKISQKFFCSDSKEFSFDCFNIWISFIKSASDSKKIECHLRVQEFFNLIHDFDLFLKDLPVKKKISLVKFLSFCVNSSEIVLTSPMLDTIIRLVLECSDDDAPIDDFCELFNEEVEVASAILKKQFAWSRSKIHLTFLMFQRLLRSLMRRYAANQQMNTDEVFKLSISAFCLEKWTSLMVVKSKDFARISAYFITALISSIASVTLLPVIKIHLTNCINHFLTVSDSYTIAYLMRILKPGYQQVFNTLYVQFEKYHKYSGKV